jgi:Bacterial regulatory proteins, gntR family
VSAWQEALAAADAVRDAHGLSATTAWLDGIVGGRLGVKVTLWDEQVITGTPREIGDLVLDALDAAPFRPGEPHYLAVADRLEARILRGKFDADGKLPPARELMAHYRVSLDVVGHARRVLKESGLVRSDGRRGTIVIPQDCPAAAPAGEGRPGSSPAGQDERCR